MPAVGKSSTEGKLLCPVSSVSRSACDMESDAGQPAFDQGCFIMWAILKKVLLEGRRDTWDD